MANAAQITANRRNAAKSTGPKTTQGKAIVARNAIKHGLLARQNVILGEDPQEFELGRRKWLAELEPVGHAEATLAERVAGLAWRLKRAERLQNEVFDSLLAKELADSMADFDDELSAEEQQELMSDPSADPRLAVGRMVARDFNRERALERLMMYERWIENSLYRTMKELRQVQRERKAEAGHGPLSPANLENHVWQQQAEPAELADATRATVTDSAKQSQSGAPQQDHRQAALGDVTDAVAMNCAKQTQFRPSQPDHCFAEAQDPASLQADDPAGAAASDSAKQSQIPGNAPCETKPMRV